MRGCHRSDCEFPSKCRIITLKDTISENLQRFGSIGKFEAVLVDGRKESQDEVVALIFTMLVATPTPMLG